MNSIYIVLFVAALQTVSGAEKAAPSKRGLELGYGAYPGAVSGNFNGFQGYAVGNHQDTQLGIPNFASSDSAFLPLAFSKAAAGFGSVNKLYAPVSPAEIAAAVTAAKEATTNVMSAQQRVHQAKEDVLLQQRIANAKEHQAAIAVQKSEAAAAVQREQASAAANSLVQAQQRLAEAKAYVAQQQRIAAIKEAQAAQVIQQNAAAAAAALHKNDNVAAKIAANQHFENTAILKHATISKAATLGANSAGVAAAHPAAALAHGPWLTQHGSVQIGPWGK